jgi:ribonuclease P protein subunit POP4
MKITPSILQHELIGLNARVVKSVHPNYVGIAGRVIDETRNTLVIQYENERKIVAKNAIVLYLTMPDGTVVEIDGKAIVGRPENRIKKRIRRRW